MAFRQGKLATYGVILMRPRLRAGLREPVHRRRPLPAHSLGGALLRRPRGPTPNSSASPVRQGPERRGLRGQADSEFSSLQASGSGVTVGEESGLPPRARRHPGSPGRGVPSPSCSPAAGRLILPLSCASLPCHSVPSVVTSLIPWSVKGSLVVFSGAYPEPMENDQRPRCVSRISASRRNRRFKECRDHREQFSGAPEAQEMVGPRDDGQLGAGDQPKHLHRVLRTNAVAVTERDQGRRFHRLDVCLRSFEGTCLRPRARGDEIDAAPRRKAETSSLPSSQAGAKARISSSRS